MTRLTRLATAFMLLALVFTSAQAAFSSKVFTVSNTGTGPMTVSGVAISGNNVDYTLTGNTCGTLSVGSSCQLTVVFTPTKAGAADPASLTFSSNGSNGPTHSISLVGVGGASAITRAIVADTSDVNMAALFGNPTVANTYVLTISSGVRVTASSATAAALTTGVFPAGSTVKVVNNGYILGAGGAGGRGGYADYGNPAYGGSYGYCYMDPVAHTAGGAGGPALVLQTPISIDNSGGYVWGGGGGGGGSAGAFMNSASSVGGNGGGAGAGGGAGGLGGVATGGSTNVTGRPGQATIASSLLPGVGGPSYYFGDATYPAETGAGGAGGNFGQAGQAGAASTQYATGPMGSCTPLTTGAYVTQGAPGGAAGRAVVTNGNTITWLGGSSGSQVKGAVQ